MNRLIDEFGEKHTRITMWMDSDNPPTRDEVLTAHKELIEHFKIQLIVEAILHLEKTLWKLHSRT